MIKYKSLNKTIIAALAAYSLAAQAGGDLPDDGTGNTLPGVVQHVVDIHPVIDARQARLDAAEYAISEERAAYFPTLDLAAGRGVEWSVNSTTRGNTGKSGYESFSRDEASLALSQLVFDGFGTPSRTRAAKRRFDSARYDLLDTGEVIGLTATQAYIDVLRQRALVSVARSSVRVHEELAESIKKREEVGYDRRADVYQAQTRLSLAKTRLAIQQGGLDDAIATYTELTGAHPMGLVDPGFDQTWMPADIEEAIALAMESSPAVAAAEYQTEADKANVKVANSVFYPSLNIELSASENEDLDGVDGQNDDLLAMLRLRHNLFRGGADLARSRQAAAAHRESIADESEVRRQIRENIRLSYSAIKEARSQIRSELDHLHSSEQLVEAYKGQFEIGTRTLLALLDAEDERFVAASNLRNQEYILLFEEYRLLANIGRLLDSLGVNLEESAAS